MKSMKTYMPVLLLGLVSLMTGTLAAQNGTLTHPSGPIGLDSSMLCNGSPVSVQGTVNILYHRNGDHEMAHYRLNATTADSAPNQYNFSLEADMQYGLDGSTTDPQVTKMACGTGGWCYFFPYHATLAGKGGAPTYNLTGRLGIFVLNGVPANDAIMSAQAACN